MKRLLDILASTLVLAAIWPFLVVVAALVRVTLGSPVFFRQERPGLGGRPFLLYKFRTMTDARDAAGAIRPDRERLTGVGRFLRKTSLDELPELFNVLRGEMSLVGPRPLLMKYCPYFTSREQLRHAVRPGITGWAQIHGRNDASWDERLASDVWYVEHWSLLLDLKILLATLLHVLCQNGVVVDARSTMKDLDEEREPMVLHGG